MVTILSVLEKKQNNCAEFSTSRNKLYFEQLCIAFYVIYLMYINLLFFNCTLHIVPSPSPLACHGIYLNNTIIIHSLSFAFWYIHIYFMKASLRFLMDNQICIEHHYSPHYVSYVNYFHLLYYDYG